MSEDAKLRIAAFILAFLFILVFFLVFSACAKKKQNYIPKYTAKRQLALEEGCKLFWKLENAPETIECAASPNIRFEEIAK